MAQVPRGGEQRALRYITEQIKATHITREEERRLGVAALDFGLISRRCVPLPVC